VLQGEREIASKNRTIGRFDLVGIPPAPRGIPQIEVTFDIDANGIMHVSAKDLGTGKEQKIRIESSSGLDEKEIDRMVKDAEAHADEDRKAKEEAVVRNEADAFAYQIDAADRVKIEDAISALKKALEGKDVEAIKSKQQALMTAAQVLGQKIYEDATRKQAEASGGAEAKQDAQAQPGGASNGEEVVDAEFEVEDEKK
jgi:molecular chaperone DnaK